MAPTSRRSHASPGGVFHGGRGHAGGRGSLRCGARKSTGGAEQVRPPDSERIERFREILPRIQLLLTWKLSRAEADPIGNAGICIRTCRMGLGSGRHQRLPESCVSALPVPLQLLSDARPGAWCTCGLGSSLACKIFHSSSSRERGRPDLIPHRLLPCEVF